MTRLLSAALLASSLLLASPANAQAPGGAPAIGKAGKFGLGAGSHAMTAGLSGKFYLADNIAVQAVAGSWWFFGFGAGVDALLEMPTFLDHEVFTLHWYVGAGGEFATYASVRGATTIGIEGVGGVAFQAKNLPIEITGELRPAFLVGSYAGWSGIWFTGSGAIRWYF